jgi:FtsP/CotA-like multicopper oxidase with cupredoxin domain
MSPFPLSRRSFLASGGACFGVGLLDPHAIPLALRPTQEPTIITAEMRTMEINGKPAKLMGLQQTDGKFGLSQLASQPFNVLLENKLPVPTAIHWHGLHPPNAEDGVPGLTQRPVEPNAQMHYKFPLRPSGTHWMHSHEGLQEAFLLSAPLIVHEPADESSDEQQIVLFLGDFSFTPPREIYGSLRSRSTKPMSMSEKKNKPDANDVNYDAYLANDRTLADPDVIRVEKNGRIRLRIINGSSGTNFFIHLGVLEGELIATDGMPVTPIRASRFPLAIAQRIDVRVQLPAEGAFPILALRENAKEQAGIILSTSGQSIKKIPLEQAAPTELLNLDLEGQLVAKQPLSEKPTDRSHDLRLTGDMALYEWSINGVVFDTANPSTQAAQLHVKSGQRVVVNFINETGMSHPMHLHGHSFQVIAIDGKPLKGAVRDTLLVPPKRRVTVAFDADNPGIWYLHCHVLWHLAAGMATLVQYEA